MANPRALPAGVVLATSFGMGAMFVHGSDGLDPIGLTGRILNDWFPGAIHITLGEAF